MRRRTDGVVLGEEHDVVPSDGHLDLAKDGRGCGAGCDVETGVVGVGGGGGMHVGEIAGQVVLGNVVGDLLAVPAEDERDDAAILADGESAEDVLQCEVAKETAESCAGHVVVEGGEQVVREGDDDGRVRREEVGDDVLCERTQDDEVIEESHLPRAGADVGDHVVLAKSMGGLVLSGVERQVVGDDTDVATGARHLLQNVPGRLGGAGRRSGAD